MGPDAPDGLTQRTHRTERTRRTDTAASRRYGVVKSAIAFLALPFEVLVVQFVLGG